MYNLKERSRLDKKVMLQAILISLKQVISISVVLYIIVKYPLIAILLLFMWFISMHTMNTYRSMMMMKNQRD